MDLGKLNKFIDGYLAQNEQFNEFHRRKSIKGYNFDLPIKIEKGMKAYKHDQIYQFRVRTVDKELLSYLMDGLADYRTDAIKGLTRTVKQIPRKQIASVYSLTPVVLKNDKGYWRDCMSFEDFERDLGSENTKLYHQLELKSKCAVGVSYKGITLLGDKLSMQVSDDENAQKVMYFALANGMGTMGARGLGFLGYRLV